MATTVTRINITIPKNLFEDLKNNFPKRFRSKVISDALKEKMTKIKREESFKKLKGVWDKAGGVSFKSEKDLKTWRRSLWTSTEKRFAKKISG